MLVPSKAPIKSNLPACWPPWVNTGKVPSVLWSNVGRELTVTQVPLCHLRMSRGRGKMAALHHCGCIQGPHECEIWPTLNGRVVRKPRAITSACKTFQRFPSQDKSRVPMCWDTLQTIFGQCLVRLLPRTSGRGVRNYLTYQQYWLRYFRNPNPYPMSSLLEEVWFVPIFQHSGKKAEVSSLIYRWMAQTYSKILSTLSWIT